MDTIAFGSEKSVSSKKCVIELLVASSLAVSVRFLSQLLVDAGTTILYQQTQAATKCDVKEATTLYKGLRKGDY